MISQSIYQDLIAAGQKAHGYYSDLYTPVNACTTALVKRHKASSSVFVNQVEGGLWYDIPFAYEPYWESKALTKENIMHIYTAQYPSTCPCPECDGALGVNPARGPVDEEGYASREVYCHECSFYIIEHLGPCGQRWD